MIKIGHRGACGYQPENTLKSFQKALEFKVDMIEFDVQTCKTGELVVIHDAKINRTTNGKGYVKNLTLSELKSLEAGLGEKIPTLEEVLDLIDKKVRVNIELKGVGTAKPVVKLIKRYVKENGWTADHFLISSFNHQELLEFHQLLPAVKIGVLFKKIPNDFTEFSRLNLKAFSVNLSLDYINQKFVNAAQRKGLKVFVYTVNEYNDIERVKNLGVDGIFSNFPDRL